MTLTNITDVTKATFFESKWKGKSFISLGDSITWQDGQPYCNKQYPSNIGHVARGYQTWMKEQLGFAGYDNFGVSGRPTANGTANGEGTNTTGKSIADYSIYDLVVIATGTNDFKLNVPISNFTEIGSAFDTATFIGAYQDLVEHILKNSPAIRLVLFTPLQRNNDRYDSTSTNKAGHKLIDYRNAIISIGEMYGLPVCDLYANSGFNMLTVFEYTMDGLHPHDIGYAAFSGYVVNFISSIVSC